MEKKKLIVGISGSSGVIYGARMIEVLQTIPTVESHLVISDAAAINLTIETETTVDQVKAKADFCYDIKNLAASISSGSFITAGMAVIPCSIKSLSSIANSFNDNLLTRAADVVLKEQRKLVLVPRETPLHKGHLALMSKVTDIGGVILPPFPAFYHRPQSILDIIDQTIGKVLDQFGIEHQLFERWSGTHH